MRVKTTALAVAALVAVPASAPAATVGQGPEGGFLERAIVFDAAPGELNDLALDSVEGNRNAVRLHDAGAPIEAGQGCATSGTDVVCEVSGLDIVLVRLGDGDDHLDASGLHDLSRRYDRLELRAEGGDGGDALIGADASSCIEGEAGDDSIETSVTRRLTGICLQAGGPGDDFLAGNEFADYQGGGEGDDRLIAGSGPDLTYGDAGQDRLSLGDGDDEGAGGAGDDRIFGAAGNDRLIDAAGADSLNGGPDTDVVRLDFRTAAGRDEIQGGAGRDRLDLICSGCEVSLVEGALTWPAGADTVAGIEDVAARSTLIGEEGVDAGDVQYFGSGRDRIVGNSLANVIHGGRGADLIEGGEGRDMLFGDTGDDRLQAADGSRDRVICGAGRDRAVVDRFDRVSGCEAVARRPASS